LTETLRLRTPATRILSAGALAFVIWKQSMRGELPCQGTYCFSLPPLFRTHYQQPHGMRNATRGMVFGLKSTGTNWLAQAPLVGRFCHLTARTTLSPWVRPTREAAVATRVVFDYWWCVPMSFGFFANVMMLT